MKTETTERDLDNWVDVEIQWWIEQKDCEEQLNLFEEE